MTMTKFDPFALVGTTLFKDLNRLFDLAPEDTSAVRDTFRPRIDLAETDEAFVVRAELPGIDPADIDVSVEDEVLTITGTRSFDTSTESEEEGVKYRRREIFEGNFARKIRLHPDVDVEQKVRLDAADCSHDQDYGQPKPRGAVGKPLNHNVSRGNGDAGRLSLKTGPPERRRAAIPSAPALGYKAAT